MLQKKTSNKITDISRIYTIAIIEDDILLNQALDTALRNAGYNTVCARTKREAVSLLGGKESLLLIDIGLPDGDGISLYKELREKDQTALQSRSHTDPRGMSQNSFAVPAIFLTARDEERDMLAAFDIGADDYVVKPFSMKVLLKRIEAVLKRSGKEEAERHLAVGELILYPDRKQVFLKGQEITLTAKEYQLLEYLMQNCGQVLTKENILEHVWGLDGQFVVDNTVSVTVNRLRRKIEPDAGQPVYIKNVFGLGYRIGEFSYV